MEWRLLAGVPEEEIRTLLSVARRRHFSRDEVVFHRDDPGDSLHLIVKGRFAIRITTPLGDTAMIGVRGPGDFFGELALLADTHGRAATVSALEEAETFAVTHSAFEALRSRHHGITDLVLRLLAGEIRRLDERLLEALYLPAEKRLRRRLCELADVYGAAGKGPIELPLTQESLAELAGTSRATVNRVLRDEEQRGTLELHRRRTVIGDLDALARRAR